MAYIKTMWHMMTWHIYIKSIRVFNLISTKGKEMDKLKLIHSVFKLQRILNMEK